MQRREKEARVCSFLAKQLSLRRVCGRDIVLFQMGHGVPEGDASLGHFFPGESGQPSHHKHFFTRYAYGRGSDECTYKQR